jgi:microcystin-dependent protein
LRGKVVVGYNPANPLFNTGVSGGSATIKLSVAQLPPHAMLVNLQVPMTGVTATTTLSSLAATADLSGVTISGEPSGLTIKASSSSTGNVVLPTNNYLSRPALANAAIYNSATPDVTLNSGSIGGTLSLTVGKGVTAPVTVSGNAATTLTGNATVSGATSIIGTGADIPVMPPYIAMPYYIAVTGLYPSSD